MILFAFLAMTSAFWGGFSFSDVDTFRSTTGGGISCAACTIVLSLTDQYINLHNVSADQFINNEACALFPAEFQSICSYFVINYGEDVIEMLFNDEDADTICQTLEFCTDSQCRLWPGAIPVPISKVPMSKRKLTETPWQWIIDLFNRLGQNHEPIVDVDGDKFSVAEELRGWDWRGMDCDDLNDQVYPGRRSVPDGQSLSDDFNCNGIYGVNSKSGVPYEIELCANTSQRGIIVLGDSAGAHFEIPPQYFTASEINSTTFSNLLQVISDEIDKPYRSSYTAFVKSQPGVPVDSVYLRLFQNNQCNHRDYQNLGVNGCRSGAMASNTVFSMARNKTYDHPALVFIELIGNDVCSPHRTLDTMTTVPQFTESILQTLDTLETALPEGSYVVFIGLADGRVLWDSLWNRTHPIGVTYQAVYNYLNCLGINPCWVWLNSNETIRNAGSARAAELSAVYPQIIANYSDKYSFQMAYFDFPFTQIIAQWVAEGGEAWELIEPVDGFHPNQQANALLGAELWNLLMTNNPDFLGDVNPNNALITKLFGNQGGYDGPTGPPKKRIRIN